LCVQLVTYQNFHGWFVLCCNEKIITRLSVCECAAYNGPFRKHYFDDGEDSLMMALTWCRNM